MAAVGELQEDAVAEEPIRVVAVEVEEVMEGGEVAFGDAVA